jgi:hypothetical protein
MDRLSYFSHIPSGRTINRRKIRGCGYVGEISSFRQHLFSPHRLHVIRPPVRKNPMRRHHHLRLLNAAPHARPWPNHHPALLPIQPLLPQHLLKQPNLLDKRLHPPLTNNPRRRSHRHLGHWVPNWCQR